MNNIHNLEDIELLEINKLLSICKNNPPLLEDVYALVDHVWDQLGCCNEYLDENKLNLFYRHPVWTLNGLFIENHGISMQHRKSIAHCIFSYKDKINVILDYGGGFGTLARLLSEKDSNAQIDVYEPHPSRLALKKTEPFPNLSFISSIDKIYDCVISTDVLEHCPNPLMSLSNMINCLKIGGILIIANHFFPIIKCHLPATFHLRYSFDIFAKVMGLTYICPCEGSHAHIYEKAFNKTINWKKIMTYEKLSKMAFPFLEKAQKWWIKLKMILK